MREIWLTRDFDAANEHQHGYWLFDTEPTERQQISDRHWWWVKPGGDVGWFISTSVVRDLLGHDLEPGQKLRLRVSARSLWGEIKMILGASIACWFAIGLFTATVFAALEKHDYGRVFSDYFTVKHFAFLIVLGPVTASILSWRVVWGWCRTTWYFLQRRWKR